MKKLIISTLCMLISIGLAVAQVRDVTGTVVDETGEPIIGASVTVKATTNGVMSNLDGQFTIKAKIGDILVFKYLGHETLELKASEKMNITMKSTSQTLTEVVVTGMTQMDRRLFTGSADRLSGEDIKLDGLAEVSRSLEGRSAGVSVQNVSGTFGAAPKIRIRGATSIYGDSKPLWVVDGIIMEDVVEVSADDLSSGDATTLISSAIAGLNANDIESFQILKDGSATSIYGARAMGGVIVITTKKGMPGQSRINYSGEYTMRLKPSYRDFNIMNSQEQMDVYNTLEQKGWLNFGDTFRANNSGVYGKMYQLIDDGKLLNLPEIRNQYLQNAEMRNTNWFDELFTNSLMHNHSVSISSGTAKSRFYVSLSALSDDGWYKESSVTRYTANINATHNIKSNLILNLIANTSYRKQKAPGTLAQTLDAVNGEVKRDFDINPYSYAINTSRTLDPNEFYVRNYAPFNILHELDNNNMEFNIADMKFQGELTWKMIPELDFKVLAAVKYSKTDQEHFIKDYSNQSMAYRAMPDATIRDLNGLLYKDPDDPYALPISILPEGGIYRKNDYKMAGYDLRASLTWNKIFDNVHSTFLFTGAEYNSVDRKKTWTNNWGMLFDMGELASYPYQYFKKGIEQGEVYYTMNSTFGRQAAYFAQGIYSYNNKYTVSGVIRFDGSNKLGMNSSARWLPTWNISGSWDAHEESFFEPLKSTISHLKLSARYSLVGDLPSWNVVSNSNVVIRSYNAFRYFTEAQESGLYIDDLENSDLTYEKKYEFNIGLDLGFLNNRINTNLEWFTRKNVDLIGLVNTPGVGGQILKYANDAEMKSSGVELTITTKNIQEKDFTWNTDLMFSKYKVEITKLKNRPRVIDLISGTGSPQLGYSHRALFSIPFEGLDKDGIPLVRDQNGNISSTDIYFQERTNIDFLKYEGPTEPTINGGFQNTFRYKQFRLNTFFTYAFGNKIRLDPAFKASYSDLDAMPKEFKNRWTLPGDEASTTVPVIISARQYAENKNLDYAYNAYNYSTARIADGGFIRLKEVSLTYDFPKSLLMRYVNDLSLKIQATNICLLYADSKLNGQDPEFFRSGGVSSPVPKQFTLTLRVGL